MSAPLDMARGTLRRGGLVDLLGGLWLLVRRSLRQHALSSVVTVLACALASGLVMSVFSIQKQTEDAFTGGEVGFDAVLGARGSQLQLVLNTVFHLETSPGNIPWTLYEEIRKRPYIDLAVPYAVGDNYFGFRIVGTTREMFTRFEYRSGQGFAVAPGGEFFDESRREAVVGHFAAEKLGLSVGSVIHPYHGLTFDETNRHDEEYVVVGVLRPTNSPSDRVIWIPIEGAFRMGGHVLRGAGGEYKPQPGEAIPDEHREVSAVMLKFKRPEIGLLLDGEVNKRGKTATLAYPIGAVMADLFNKMGWVTKVLQLVAYLVMIVAAGAILASIYNTINERRREFAILRSLGARRTTVFSAIVLESSAIAGTGAVLGFAFYFAVFAGAAAVVRSQTGVVLDLTAYHPAMWMTPLGMIALGALSGTVPALRAYSTDVATNLSPGS